MKERTIFVFRKEQFKYIKIKHLFSTKANMKIVNRQWAEREKIFALSKIDKGFILLYMD